MFRCPDDTLAVCAGFLGCFNTSPQTLWLKTRIYSLPVLGSEVQSQPDRLSRCHRAGPLGRTQRRLFLSGLSQPPEAPTPRVAAPPPPSKPPSWHLPSPPVAPPPLPPSSQGPCDHVGTTPEHVPTSGRWASSSLQIPSCQCKVTDSKVLGIRQWTPPGTSI